MDWSKAFNKSERRCEDRFKNKPGKSHEFISGFVEPLIDDGKIREKMNMAIIYEQQNIRSQNLQNFRIRELRLCQCTKIRKILMSSRRTTTGRRTSQNKDGNISKTPRLPLLDISEFPPLENKFMPLLAVRISSYRWTSHKMIRWKQLPNGPEKWSGRARPSKGFGKRSVE